MYKNVLMKNTISKNKSASILQSISQEQNSSMATATSWKCTTVSSEVMDVTILETKEVHVFYPSVLAQPYNDWYNVKKLNSLTTGKIYIL
jgi:hypothetical protein